MSGSERAGFAHYEFGAAARAAAVEHANVPRRPGRLDLLMQQINDRLPVTLRGRWRLDRRTGTALAAAVAVTAVVLGGWTLFRAQSKQVARPQLLSAGHQVHRQTSDSASRDAGDEAQQVKLEGAPPQAAPYPASSTIGIVVDVEGKVAKPGVFHLPTGSRVMDAIRAAGGALPGTDLVPLNQARVLNDGEQVLVGASGGLDAGLAGPAPAPTSHAGGRGKVPLSGPVHLNTATADQLEQLPGVGPAMAQRILDWRAEHGRFSSIGELQQVRGLGPNKFAALRQWVTP